MTNPTSGLQVPSAILQKRLSTDGDLKEVLVQWSGWLSSLTTWENFEDFHRCFPGAPAWGQDASFGGGCQHCC
jgi:hypothetical protein